MNSFISELPTSPEKLNKKNIKKIHKYIPVPTDYKILWADIEKYGGYPSGVVVTDKGIIVKASKIEVKKYNQYRYEDSNEKRTMPRVKTLYRIIPWEYYNPSDYNFLKETDQDGNVKYVFYADDMPLCHFKDKSFYTLLQKQKNNYLKQEEISDSIIQNSSISAMNSENVGEIFFNATYGKETVKTGHGIYAEEAGAILDKINGDQVAVVGRDNAKNGPDKIVNSSPIQCKYCKTPSASINACFSKDSLTGNTSYRYLDLNGKPMKVEVPSDQYNQAIEIMKNKIKKGQVPGINDINQAYDIVRKGKITYNQALNLAKAGTIESITYDAYTGAINCLSVFGISSLFTFAQVYWSTKDIKKASKTALITGLQVYGITWFGGVVASQISRTSLIDSVVPITDQLLESLNPQITNNIINSFRYLAGKKAICGSTAQKSFLKFLDSTIVTQCIMIIAFGMPDTFKMLNNKISTAQYAKNMISLVGSFTTSIIASASVGAEIGKRLGDNSNKELLSKAGMVCGMVAGTVMGTAIKAIGNTLREDDAVITTRLFNAILSNMFIDYMLNNDEQDCVIAKLNLKDKELVELQQNLIHSNHQELDIKTFLIPIFNEIVKERENLTEDNELGMNREINDIIMNGGLSYEM